MSALKDYLTGNDLEDIQPSPWHGVQPWPWWEPCILMSIVSKMIAWQKGQNDLKCNLKPFVTIAGKTSTHINLDKVKNSPVYQITVDETVDVHVHLARLLKHSNRHIHPRMRFKRCYSQTWTLRNYPEHQHAITQDTRGTRYPFLTLPETVPPSPWGQGGTRDRGRLPRQLFPESAEI